MKSERDVVSNVLRLLQKAKSLAPAEAAIYLRPLLPVMEGYGAETSCAREAAVSLKSLIVALSAGTHPPPDMWSTSLRKVELWDEQLGREA